MDPRVACSLWGLIVEQLDQRLPDWMNEIDAMGQLAAIDARRSGRLELTDPDVFRGLVWSVLSSSTEWSKVAGVLDGLSEPFNGFDPEWFSDLSTEGVDGVVSWFVKRRASSQFLPKNLLRLRHAARLLVVRSSEHGGLNQYLADLSDRKSGDAKLMALALGGASGSDKLPTLGVALAAEFLKNVGYDVAKPDRHVNRASGAFGMVEFAKWPDRPGTKAPTAKESELLAVMSAMESFAGQVGQSTTLVDNAVWLLCAKSGLYLDNDALAELRDQAAR